MVGKRVAVKGRVIRLIRFVFNFKCRLTYVLDLVEFESFVEI